MDTDNLDQMSLDDLEPHYSRIFNRLSVTFEHLHRHEGRRRDVDELRRRRQQKYGIPADSPESLERDALFATIAAEMAFLIQDVNAGFAKMAERDPKM